MRPKWILTTTEAAGLLQALPALPQTMVGLALLSGLRRGELFALRWRDVDAQSRLLRVREAVYDGAFSTPKTEAGMREIPLSEAALQLIAVWRSRAANLEPPSLVFSSPTGTALSPNHTLRRPIYPACDALGLRQPGSLSGARTRRGRTTRA